MNLPSTHKMTPPKYQDIPAAKIPFFEAAPGVTAKARRTPLGDRRETLFLGMPSLLAKQQP